MHRVPSRTAFPLACAGTRRIGLTAPTRDRSHPWGYPGLSTGRSAGPHAAWPHALGRHRQSVVQGWRTVCGSPVPSWPGGTATFRQSVRPLSSPSRTTIRAEGQGFDPLPAGYAVHCANRLRSPKTRKGFVVGHRRPRGRLSSTGLNTTVSDRRFTFLNRRIRAETRQVFEQHVGPIRSRGSRVHATHCAARANAAARTAGQRILRWLYTLVCWWSWFQRCC